MAGKFSTTEHLRKAIQRLRALATTVAPGLMSAPDKVKMDGIAPEADDVSVARNLTSGTKIATVTINGTDYDLYAPEVAVDSALSSSSTNPVQNKVIGTALAAKQPQHKTVTVTLAASATEWTVAANGVTADNTLIVSPDAASMEAYAAAGVKCTAQAANSLTFTAATAPSAALTVDVLILD